MKTLTYETKVKPQVLRIQAVFYEENTIHISPSELYEFLILLISIFMLIALAKSRSARGASYQSAFMSSCLTIGHTLYLPYLPSA